MKSSHVRFRRQLTLALLGMVLTTLAQETLWVRTVDLGADEAANGTSVLENTIVAAGYRFETEGDWLVVRLNQSGDTLWTRTLNIMADDNAIDACIDREHNILIAGFTMVYSDQRRPYGPKRLMKPWHSLIKDQQMFALTAKFDSAGVLKWQRVDTSCVAYGIGTDSVGNCFVSGVYYDGTVWDVWVAKLDPLGGTIWTRRFDLAPLELGCRLALDASGNVVVALYFGDFSNFDCGVLKLSPAGETLWTRRCDLNIEDAGIGITTDREDNIIVVGFTGDGSGAYDFLIAKFDPSGNPVWQRSIDRDLDDEAFGVTCDSAGSIYATGSTGPGYSYDCLTMKLSPAGETLWTATYGSYLDDEAGDVACDSAGNPVVVGGSEDTLTGSANFLAIKYQPFVGIAERVTVDHGCRTRTSSTITAAPGFLISVPLSGRYDIRLCDLCGNFRQQIYRGRLTKGLHRFSLTGLTAGHYFIRVATPDGRISCHRLIIVR